MSAARGRLARLRHQGAAALGVAGIVIGAVAAVSSPAGAADAGLVGTTKFSCALGDFPAYDWSGEITLSAVRPADSTTVTVTASLSEMSGVAPVQMNNYAFTNSLDLTLGGTPVTLSGSGTVSNSGPSQPFAMPDLQGTFTSSADEVAVGVAGYEFTVTAFGLTGVCVPTAGAELGTLALAEGTPPTASPTPTTTTTATSTPPASPSAAPSSAAGKPAKGNASFACTLSIGSKFDYDANITVSGFREKEGDDVSLVATMSNLPGIAPVPIDGSMDYTLEAEIGGKATTLTSTGDVHAEPNKEVPVTDLSGSVAVDGDALEVAVSAFTFDFPSAGIGAECVAERTVLGEMTVGSERIEPGGGGGDAGGAAGGSTASPTSSSLPKTGGGDSLPVVALWALALTLLGAAGLLCVPQRRRAG